MPALQVHLTLRFIGEVDDDRAGTIETALAGIEAVSFPLRLAGVGRFGRSGHARHTARSARAGVVLWAGVEASAALERLHDAVEAAVVAAGVAADGRRFHPHVTLARCRPEAPEALLHDWLEGQRHWVGEPFVVERFVLMESRLLPGGADHRCRRAFALAPPVSHGRNPT